MFQDDELLWLISTGCFLQRYVIKVSVKSGLNDVTVDFLFYFSCIETNALIQLLTQKLAGAWAVWYLLNTCVCKARIYFHICYIYVMCDSIC